MINFYRIKELKKINGSTDTFIPQKLIFFLWEGIDEIEHSYITWYSAGYQHTHCGVSTLDRAKEIIAGYKQSRIKPKVRYHYKIK